MQLFTHLLSSYLQGIGDFFSALPKERGKPRKAPEGASRPSSHPQPPPRHDPTPIIAKQGATDTIPARPSSPHVPIYNIIMCRYCQKLMN